MDTAAGFQKTLQDCASRETMRPTEPEKALKIIEGAISFAAAAGFRPHKNYSNIALLFSDIDASLCEEEFTYGHEGKPLFIQGPHDSPSKTARILKTMREKLGDDGFHFTVQSNVFDKSAELPLTDPGSNLIG
jgi:hypothetical protein